MPDLRLAEEQRQEMPTSLQTRKVVIFIACSLREIYRSAASATEAARLQDRGAAAGSPLSRCLQGWCGVGSTRAAGRLPAALSSRAGTDPAAVLQIQQVLQLHLVRWTSVGSRQRQEAPSNDG